ncbi:hypothetical protein D9M68_556000 [compost metagenome]
MLILTAIHQGFFILYAGGIVLSDCYFVYKKKSQNLLYLNSGYGAFIWLIIIRAEKAAHFIGNMHFMHRAEGTGGYHRQCQLFK